MLKIRLSRVGSKGKPFYRVVAIDERKKLNGPAVEILGTYNPIKKLLNLPTEKVDAWVKKGAVISPTVLELMKK